MFIRRFGSCTFWIGMVTVTIVIYWTRPITHDFRWIFRPPATSKMVNLMKHSMKDVTQNLEKIRQKSFKLFNVIERRRQQTPKSSKFLDVQSQHDSIDVVYTWVNGSDPEFQKSLQEELLRNQQTQRDAVNTGRFFDWGTLRYSLRSLEMFASGWVRNVYLVTNGQVPSWINQDHPRLRLVTHKDIFGNRSYLPTFSSRAIEHNLFRIPGLSEKFLYFNDDFVLSNKVSIDHLIYNGTGQYIYTDFKIDSCSPYNRGWFSLNSNLQNENS